MATNQAYEQVVSALPGEERGMPSVNNTGLSTPKRGLIVLGLLLLLCASIGVGYWKYKANSARENETAKQNVSHLTSAVPARTFSEPPPALPQPTSPDPLPGSANALAAAPALPGSMTMGNGNSAQILDKAGSSLMAIGGRQETPVLPVASGGVSSGEGPQRGQASNGDELSQQSGGMAEMLSGTRTPMRKATMLGDRNFILAKGSFIDCALQTRIDSTVPGMTACVITRNIYSDNGKVLLLERGSTASGEYKSNMRQGQARIGVLWTRIKTPNGVLINLDSGGTDQLGGAGVPGYIDTHFWERFGAAIMLSLIDDVARGVTSNGTGGGNNQINFNSTSQAGQDMAAEALKNTINIPPTLYKNQGEQVGIYVARDLDFSSVYDVAAQ
ncbi:MAG TPA: type IV secretion system protein VirB10 [Oligoflexus sp.]|uniref:type IV secretion system protein VirB10 n=1 Tax=Oligoflexus sp. TaxID=1971216 RepID=UPI002D7FEFBD|nr:type IV secretion system protein VirB10 [Oligoflexus sp.]HET9239199.1 type IV secretion system protein VirB10 [Oligoflexus sp.]